MPPKDLVEILKQLPQVESKDLLVGSDTLDDAGVFAIDADRALVQTLDFFPPIVDDPVWFGRIAAANSLSDIYAMGASPLTVMNIVGFPKELPLEILGLILRGSAEKVVEAGAVVVGGHSVQDAEVKFGLSVTGVVRRDEVITNAGARPGDVLVLSKPIGMGCVSTAIKLEKIAGDRIEAASVQMATLNRDAAEAMREVEASAATDITGFGLMGHARGMARASGVTIEIDASSVPLFDGALELAEQKLLSGGAKRTRLFLGTEAEVGSRIPGPLADLMFDAETSGGLLMAVRPERADELVRLLRERRALAHAVVGRVLERDPGGVSVRLV